MADRIPESEVTPEVMYLNRRRFMRGAIVAAGGVGTALLYRKFNGLDNTKVNAARLENLVVSTDPRFVTNETKNTYDQITHYNNFYEFTTDKDGVAKASVGFDTSGWKIEVGGLCAAPRTFDMDMLMKLAPVEERIYRLRCVEAWSMVVPWAGIPLSALIAAVQPLGSAKYVAMETLNDPKRFPGQADDILDWPYREGLRIDEAMHPLALLAVGLYGKTLPPQDGAPVRLVVPWKYGFKNIKSIVKITFTDKEPPTSWSKYAVKEYGFYGNVNPNHPHPRWSQATEQRIGESGRRKTLPFNGYADQVASLYTGMDLDVHF
ncbi:MAG TPA: protein-methionine-sulfoxide reductase catalytic subunit MsrP [Kofleriaceae bacterium]|jgi:sulfoxide reductase catalytic subunit YedY